MPLGAPGTTGVVFDLPSGLRDLSEDQPHTAQLPAGGTQGRNSWGDVGYGGPCPPAGPAHTYRFTLYAVDGSLGLSKGTSTQQVLDQLMGRTLAQNLLTGSYEKRTGGGNDDGDGGDGY